MKRLTAAALLLVLAACEKAPVETVSEPPASGPSEASPIERLSKDGAGQVVQRGIDYAGGWKEWSSKSSLSFRKTTTKFREDGTVESTRVQIHQYVLQPGPKMRITWEDDGRKIVLINHGWEAWRVADGVVATDVSEKNGARNATFGSHYVVLMPFKLTDRGANLASAGSETLADGTKVDKVRVTYDKGAGDAGGLHTWTYMFAGDGRLVANHLEYEAGKYDYTEYSEETVIDGIRFPMLRTGYHADAKGKIGKKTSEIRYEDVNFNVPLDPSLFAAPSS